MHKIVACLQYVGKSRLPQPEKQRAAGDAGEQWALEAQGRCLHAADAEQAVKAAAAAGRGPAAALMGACDARQLPREFCLQYLPAAAHARAGCQICCSLRTSASL